MSIVLTVAAVIFASMLPGQEAGDTNRKTITNTQKLERVEEAMRSFMAFNGRRPCPADGQYAINTANFGKEAATPGTCTGGTPAAPLGPDAGTSNIVGGVIPTRSLGLPDDYAFDEFGHRFTYVVDKRATSLSTCRVLENLTVNSSAGTGTGGLVIQNTTSSGTIIDNVMYAYISHGASGYGAWPEQVPTAGGAPANRINSGSTDGDMQNNAGVDVGANPGASTFTYNTTNFTNVKVQKDRVPSTSGDTGFDDLVWYRNDIKNTCCLGSICIPQGFRLDGAYSIGFNNGGIGTNAYFNNPFLSVAVGDINCDGYPDIVTGSFKSNQVSVIFGGPGNTLQNLSPLLLSNLNGSNGFNIAGQAGDFVAPTVATGNLNGVTSNGHSCDDIIITAGVAITTFNKVYVVYGQPTWSRSSYTLDNNATTGLINGTNGFEIDDSTAGEHFGWTLATGDINGDGYKDLIISASFATPVSGVANAGKVYVMYGKSGTWTTPQTIGTLMDGTHGFELDGVLAGISFTPGLITNITGDVNGDGKADLVLSAPWIAPGAYSQAGAAYVIFGKAAPQLPAPTVTTHTTTCVDSVSSMSNLAVYQTVTGTGIPAGTTITALATCNGGSSLTLSQATTSSTTTTMTVVTSPVTAITDGTHGFEIDGYGNNDRLTTVGVGDINNDGFADLLMENYNQNSGMCGTYAALQVIYGHAAPWASVTQLSAANLNGTIGFYVCSKTASGAGDYLLLGSTPLVADVNKDGYPDIILLGGMASANGSSTYVLFGGPTGYEASTTAWPASSTLNAAYVDGTRAVELDIPSSAYAVPIAVADINGDGYPDIIISNPFYNAEGLTDSGGIWGVWGKKAAAWKSSPVTSLDNVH